LRSCRAGTPFLVHPRKGGKNVPGTLSIGFPDPPERFRGQTPKNPLLIVSPYLNFFTPWKISGFLILGSAFDFESGIFMGYGNSRQWDMAIVDKLG